MQEEHVTVYNTRHLSVAGQASPGAATPMGQSQSGGAGPWLNTLEKSKVNQTGKGWSPERQEGG